MPLNPDKLDIIWLKDEGCVPTEEIEATLVLAIIATEAIHVRRQLNWASRIALTLHYELA